MKKSEFWKIRRRKKKKDVPTFSPSGHDPLAGFVIPPLNFVFLNGLNSWRHLFGKE